MNTCIRMLLAIVLMCAVAACSSSYKKRMRPDIGYVQGPVETIPKPKYPGSLYEQPNGNSILYVDRKAMQVNDIVTVLIVENASAVGASNTKTDKSSTYSGEVTQLFGLPSSLGMSNFLGSGEPFQPKVGGNATAAFAGGGDTQRSNQLTATITARVVKVYPNATMRIVGGREVTINNDTQYIVLSGTIRREDISPTNMIRSDYIADARIEYYGEGVLTDRNNPGWLARGLDWLWPF